MTFTDNWGTRYPAITKLWENAWAEFVPFLQFDTEIRAVVCTTNAPVILSRRPGALVFWAVRRRGHVADGAVGHRMATVIGDRSLPNSDVLVGVGSAAGASVAVLADGMGELAA